MGSETEKLKICHVITRMIVGGAQENTLLTIKGHLAKGHYVELATGPSPGREGKLLENSGMPEFKVCEFPDMVRELSPFCCGGFATLRKSMPWKSCRKWPIWHSAR